MKFFKVSSIAFVAVFSISAFAGGGGEINIPGIGSAKGGTTSTVKNSAIVVDGNSAKDVKAGGGSAGGYGVNVSMESTANVNSVNVSGSKVENSTLAVTGNSAKGVNAFGGTANVNSINIQ